MKKKAIIIFLIGFFGQGQAQNLEKISIKKIFEQGLSINGNVSANQMVYTAWGMDARRPPFNHLYKGGLNISLLGKLNIPINFSYTNQRATISKIPNVLGSSPVFAQPFNRLSLKPTYKGARLHLGTCALNFSQNTLANHRFQGVGFEYKDTKMPFYGAVMYGKLLMPVPFSATPGSKPAYGRIGWGGKFGYQKEQDMVELILFGAEDKINSLKYILDSAGVFPQSNLVLSFKGKKELTKKISLNAELASSVINNGELDFADTVPKLAKKQDAKHTLSFGADYKHEKTLFGVQYERIAPDYRTFGGYMFNNDLETWKLKTSKSFLDDKIPLNVSLGTQRRNLSKTKPQKLKEIVWALDGAYNPTDKLNISLNYSTFANYTNFMNQYQYLAILDTYQQIDTLNYRQINNTVSSAIVFKLPDANKNKKTLSANITYQSGEDQKGDILANNNLSNATFNYAVTNEEKKQTKSIGLNFITNNREKTKDITFGPMVAFNQSFLKDKIQLGTNFIYSQSRSEIDQKKTQKNIAIGNLNIQGNIAQNQKMTLTATFLDTKNPKNKLKTTENFSELTLNLSYVYQFKIIELKPKK